jgi:hypothetical protein
MAAEPICPPSEVADTITEWTAADGSLNVAPGDLVVHDGAFEMVAAIEPYEDFLGSRFLYVRFEGSEVTPKFRVAELVAVRRYTTGAVLRPEAGE